MAGDQEIEAMILIETLVPTAIVAAREVRDHNLPIGFRSNDLLLQPLLLRSVRPHEPILASPNVRHAIVGRTLGIGGVVLLGAHVVLRLCARVHRVVRVGVDEEVLREKVGVLHLLAVVPRWHDPIVVDERVADLLRPAHVELPAAIVVVPQSAQPRFVCQLPIDPLPTRREVRLSLAPSRIRRHVAIHLDPAIIEIVPDIEDVLGISPSCTTLHRVGHAVLCVVVYACLGARGDMTCLQGGAPIANGKDVGLIPFVVDDLHVPIVFGAIILCCRVGHRQVTLVHLEGSGQGSQARCLSILYRAALGHEKNGATRCQARGGGEHDSRTAPNSGFGLLLPDILTGCQRGVPHNLRCDSCANHRMRKWDPVAVLGPRLCTRIATGSNGYGA
mmetsp:Transcript_71639/g.180801  ORF Transcript_71639/g.180801 Transcript_71639/m.180801 type:complete len:389 (+) Transcript_71639:829-1995(+)